MRLNNYRHDCSRFLKNYTKRSNLQQSKRKLTRPRPAYIRPSNARTPLPALPSVLPEDPGRRCGGLVTGSAVKGCPLRPAQPQEYPPWGLAAEDSKGPLQFFPSVRLSSRRTICSRHGRSPAVSTTGGATGGSVGQFWGAQAEICFCFFNAACGDEQRQRALGALWFHLCAVGLTRPRRRKGLIRCTVLGSTPKHLAIPRTPGDHTG